MMKRERRIKRKDWLLVNMQDRWHIFWSWSIATIEGIYPRLVVPETETKRTVIHAWRLRWLLESKDLLAMQDRVAYHQAMFIFQGRSILEIWRPWRKRLKRFLRFLYRQDETISLRMLRYMFSCEIPSHPAFTILEHHGCRWYHNEREHLRQDVDTYREGWW